MYLPRSDIWLCTDVHRFTLHTNPHPCNEIEFELTYGCQAIYEDSSSSENLLHFCVPGTRVPVHVLVKSV